jgi:hypothetical protein
MADFGSARGPMAGHHLTTIFLVLIGLGCVSAANPNSNFNNKIYSRIAVGSCTSYDETPQTIWLDVSVDRSPQRHALFVITIYLINIAVHSYIHESREYFSFPCARRRRSYWPLTSSELTLGWKN